VEVTPMIRHLVALFALSLTLAACGSGPPPPTWSDAFKGIYNQSAATVPADAPAVVPQPVGIIFSDNAEAYIDWIKRTGEYWDSVVPAALKNDPAYADADPRYVTGRVLALLKQRFPASETVKSFPQAVSSGKRSVCLVDIRMKPMEPYGDRTTKLDITLYLFDEKMNPVSQLGGHGEHHAAFGEATAGVQQATDQALQQLETKLNTLVH
jgi:hypothetical protein